MGSEGLGRCPRQRRWGCGRAGPFYFRSQPLKNLAISDFSAGEALSAYSRAPSFTVIDPVWRKPSSAGRSGVVWAS